METTGLVNLSTWPLRSTFAPHPGAFDESAIWRQSHHRADQGEIILLFFFKEDDFTDLTWKDQFIICCASQSPLSPLTGSSGPTNEGRGAS